MNEENSLFYSDEKKPRGQYAIARKPFAPKPGNLAPVPSRVAVHFHDSLLLDDSLFPPSVCFEIFTTEKETREFVTLRPVARVQTNQREAERGTISFPIHVEVRIVLVIARGIGRG